MGALAENHPFPTEIASGAPKLSTRDAAISRGSIVQDPHLPAVPSQSLPSPRLPVLLPRGRAACSRQASLPTVSAPTPGRPVALSHLPERLLPAYQRLTSSMSLPQPHVHRRINASPDVGRSPTPRFRPLVQNEARAGQETSANSQTSRVCVRKQASAGGTNPVPRGFKPSGWHPTFSRPDSYKSISCRCPRCLLFSPIIQHLIFSSSISLPF